MTSYNPAYERLLNNIRPVVNVNKPFLIKRLAEQKESFEQFLADGFCTDITDYTTLIAANVYISEALENGEDVHITTRDMRYAVQIFLVYRGTKVLTAINKSDLLKLEEL